jgi:hypothetical protein
VVSQGFHNFVGGGHAVLLFLKKNLVIFVGPLINGPDKKLGLIHRDYRNEMWWGNPVTNHKLTFKSLHLDKPSKTLP